MDYWTRKHLLRDDAFLQQTAHLTNKELAPMLGISPLTLSKYRKGFHHAVGGNGAAHLGNVGETLASSLLYANSVTHELMPIGHPYDILALGAVRLDVKIANKPIGSSVSKYINPVWRFNVRQGKRADADFYFCIITPTEEVFVIPSREISPEAREIRFTHPSEQTKQSNWQQYLNAYDLIFEFANRTV